MLDWNQCPAVERVPGKLSGVWLFKGTRVPVKSLLENLEDGVTVDDFLRWFPGVKRGQVLEVLEFAEGNLTERSKRVLLAEYVKLILAEPSSDDVLEDLDAARGGR
jgi:uncharacterized protein (DUF433 family)